ncbi:thioredoxin domain-containing protein [Sphingomonas sp. S-NIH.Pt15_0812]|uniref:DsbA family protein n=1 Tax=Sphingomonas sp. S-NIH.Pt15_0812 TaxID=1920129 RepID=UPI000F7DF99B|nr:thioredoxin domain-containing protein [Sphingomonas sp. S-NIH.Pt15_0812]RSU46713.1 hypothetical protein BRX43_15180 [Sphingomonas sp. S-NIH.Pt15_0812]
MRLLPVALALLALPLTLAGAAPVRDWSRTATMNADGAYVIGNPAARVKLREWASYTCPHCAHFSAESEPVLTNRMIRSGSTSLEVRHMVRDPLDLGAAILTRCAGPRGFAGAHRAVFAAQDQWFKKGADYAQAQAERLEKLPNLVAVRQLADGAGLTAILTARGLTPGAINACFADQKAVDRLLKLSDSVPAEVTGTPSFYINGKLIPNATWVQLEPALRAAGAK